MKIYHIILFVIICKSFYAQNLINNGDFEQNYKCPPDISQMKFVNYWTLSHRSSDYFNICNESLDKMVKRKEMSYRNYCGFQTPHSGVGYAGFIPVNEFLQTKLSVPMKKDSLYYLSFYVNRADYTNASVSKIGIYITEKAIGEEF